MTKYLKLTAAALIAAVVLPFLPSQAHATRLGHWTWPTFTAEHGVFDDITVDEMIVGTVTQSGPLFLQRLTTTTIANSNLGMSQFFAVDSLGNFLALCVSTGGIGGSVLASDGLTPCHGATFATPPQGTAAPFVLLSAAGGGGGAVTVTGSTITGNVGSTGNSASITNTGSFIFGSTIAPVAAQVAIDFNNAYGFISSQTCGAILTGTLAGVSLNPGVYCFTGAATLTGSVTLNGTPNAKFVFKIGTGGTGALTGNSFTVLLANGQKADNVNWWTKDGTTLTDSFFNGNVLSGAALTITRGTFDGHAWATGGVTTTNASVTISQQ